MSLTARRIPTRASTEQAIREMLTRLMAKLGIKHNYRTSMASQILGALAAAQPKKPGLAPNAPSPTLTSINNDLVYLLNQLGMPTGQAYIQDLAHSRHAQVVLGELVGEMLLADLDD